MLNTANRDASSLHQLRHDFLNLKTTQKLRNREAAQALGISEGEALAAFIGEHVVRLEPNFVELFEQMPQLGAVMALTRNEAAVHEKDGAFEDMSHDGLIGLVLGADIDPTVPVAHLTAEARTTVAIARALRAQSEGAGLIVLDEPTRALAHDSAQSLYAILRRAADSGTSIMVVAHSLAEVLAISDRVTVLRDGRVVVDGLTTGELSEQGLARHLLGRDLDKTPIASERPAQSAHVTVRGLAVGASGRMDIAISQGEVVGVTGRQGSGWEAVPYLVTGALPARTGVLEVGPDSIDLHRADVRSLLRLGVVLVPERRDVHGLATGLSVAENISLPRLSARGRPWFSGLKWQRDEAADVVTRLGVRPPDPAMPVGQLSGGNQQKVLFGKWMLGEPAFLVLHEPTQGVDLAARRDLLGAVVAAAGDGTSVLMASSDVNDLSAVCHRVLVVRDGTVVQELAQPDPDEIVDAVFEGMPQMGRTA